MIISAYGDGGCGKNMHVWVGERKMIDGLSSRVEYYGNEVECGDGLVVFGFMWESGTVV